MVNCDGPTELPAHTSYKNQNERKMSLTKQYGVENEVSTGAHWHLADDSPFPKNSLRQQETLNHRNPTVFSF